MTLFCHVAAMTFQDEVLQQRAHQWAAEQARILWPKVFSGTADK
jgi:hypothetical protein